MSNVGGGEIELELRVLRVRGMPAAIGRRPFEIMELLIRSVGQVVTKDDIIEHVWAGHIVEDNTIQVHISAVRKSLGSDRGLLKTISGRGYRLLGDWTIKEKDTHVRPDPTSQPGLDVIATMSNIPSASSNLLGRETALQTLSDLASAYRVVTLTGPGGIGKTVLAMELARRLFPVVGGDAWFVELAPVADPRLVPSVVAGVLGLRIGGAEITPASVAKVIGKQRVLLVLDNCEHVIEAAATLTAEILGACPFCTVLVTSREILRVDGEYAYRVSPLIVPSVSDEDPVAVLAYSALELFVTRTKERGAEFSPLSRNVAAAVAICRHLDGIPLAIEFAAARASALGLQKVADSLDDRFALLTVGRRTALPRHQTLRAVLDWSYDLLPDTEKLLLRCLSVFPAGFTLDAAVAVMGGVGLEPLVVTDGVANLVFKSLLSLSKLESEPRWHLLETTRVYALEKFRETDVFAKISRCHAECYLTLLAPFEASGQLQSAIDSLDSYRPETENFRAALTWAFSSGGDTDIGVALAVVGADFWATQSLHEDSRQWSTQALSRLSVAVGTRQEMILQCSLAMSLIFLKGMTEDARKGLSRGRFLAQKFADADYLQRTTHGLWLFSARSSALDEAFALACQYEETARSGSLQAKAVADCWLGTTLIYRGVHEEARERLNRAIADYPIDNRSQDMIRFGGDTRASASGHIAVSLMSLGFVDAASQSAVSAVEEARSANQVSVLCVALAWAAALIFLSLDELGQAELYGGELLFNAQKHALNPFQAIGFCVRGSLAARRDDVESGIELLRQGLEGMRQASYLLFYPFFLVELAWALGAHDDVDDGLVEIETALRFAEDTGHRWYVPETLRMKGELLARRGSDDPEAVAECYRGAMGVAQQQGALYWELSAAISLMEFMRHREEAAEARTSLASIRARFTEGFSASKLKLADIMLT